MREGVGQELIWRYHAGIYQVCEEKSLKNPQLGWLAAGIEARIQNQRFTTELRPLDFSHVWQTLKSNL